MFYTYEQNWYLPKLDAQMKAVVEIKNVFSTSSNSYIFN